MYWHSCRRIITEGLFGFWAGNWTAPQTPEVISCAKLLKLRTMSALPWMQCAVRTSLLSLPKTKTKRARIPRSFATGLTDNQLASRFGCYAAVERCAIMAWAVSSFDSGLANVAVSLGFYSTCARRCSRFGRYCVTHSLTLSHFSGPWGNRWVGSLPSILWVGWHCSMQTVFRLVHQ